MITQQREEENRASQPSSQKRIRRELIRNNLDTCFMFAGLAKHEIEAGKRGPAERAFGCAQCSYEAILRFLKNVENEEQRSEVQTKVLQLREGLDLLTRELNKPEALVHP
jgi:hypothetical protein